jgi:hypothetical protein
MRKKHPGGRGHRAGNKYERFTVTLPPDLKALLDEWAVEGGVSRSEALAQVIEERGQVLARAKQLGVTLERERLPRKWPEGVREHMEALEARFPRGGQAIQGELLAPAPADPAEEELRLADGPPVTALSPYAAVIVADLGAGARLTRNPGESWRLARPDGTFRTVRGDTIFGLLASGVLTVG